MPPPDCRGGAIYWVNATQAIINNCILDGNRAYHGGAVVTSNAERLTFSSSDFINNNALVNGGGMFAEFGSFSSLLDTNFRYAAMDFSCATALCSVLFLVAAQATEQGGSIYVETYYDWDHILFWPTM
jgi:hypothetical protein